MKYIWRNIVTLQ